MDAAQKQIIDSITSASNILVTVSTDPSVDGLSAALGLTLLLDKMDKRATAIFSGAIPPAINFLEPDKTFESSADSLRDFIIALDKEKADHLRYKVDGDVVKIFITPYKTKLTEKDLEFSQGDYNVELIVALGVKDQNHLDKALDAHGKILHDAKVVTITAGADASSLGTADWHDKDASSLSEMVGSLAAQLSGDQKLLDEQIATALLTGVVSATDRFSNDHTSSRVMTMAAQLMAAGANQQLIAAKLEEGHNIGPNSSTNKLRKSEGTPKGKGSDGTELVIQRGDDKTPSDEENKKSEKVIKPPEQSPTPNPEPKEPSEDVNQAELEQQLANLTKPEGTLADMEKQLQDATVESPQVPPPLPEQPADSLTASSDTSMPGFEPTANDTQPAAPPAAPVPAVPEAPAPPVEPTAPLPIIQEHGPISQAPPEETPPINSIQAGQEEESVVNPFDVPATPHESAPVMPDTQGGTPEGAAALAAPPDQPAPQESVAELPPMPALPGEPTVEPAVPPVASLAPVETQVPELPPLPPLPPLPSDGSMPPLPPPPPPPVFGGSGATPSGAVSGDVFGDGSVSPAAPPQAPPSSEPGMFKIPGQ